MEAINKKIVFISWASPVPRSDNISNALGGHNITVEIMKGSSLLMLPLRYLLQSIKTVMCLRQERPDIIFAMNPPIILPLIVFLYAKTHKLEFVIDSHTGAFFGKWEKFLFLHKFLSRRALTTIVTNRYLKELVNTWGANAFVLEDRIPNIPIMAKSSKYKSFSICVINSYSEDEPLEEILSAAKALQEYDFYITGNPSKAKREVLNKKTQNVTLTGFLPYPDYVELLNSVDAIMVLVKNDFTMLCGDYEAVSVGKPLITSDWPALKEYFNQGVYYVDNKPSSIEDAVRYVVLNKETMTKEINILKKTLIKEWDLKLESLIEVLEGRS